MSSEDMNLSINGQSQVPPGFRFHPTEEELLHYYLRKKVAYEKIDLDVIREVDLNKLEPWDIQERCKIGSTPQNDWYFFSHKDKKYPTGTRTNRATAAGFWKATGRDKIIYSSFRRIGLRKTLVFYKGRAPHGQKSDWIMHEYRLDDGTHDNTISNGSIPMGDAVQEEGWVVCRVFRKKNYQKTLDSSPNKCSSLGSMDSKNSHHFLSPCRGENGVLDQLLLYMGRTTTCKMETDALLNHINLSGLNNARFLSENSSILNEGLHERFMHLPRLNSPSSSTLNHGNPVQMDDGSPYQTYDEMLADNDHHDHQHSPTNRLDSSTNWVALDRLVASQLNGTHCQVDASKQVLNCFDDSSDHQGFGLSDPDHDQEIQLPPQFQSDQAGSNIQAYGGDNELWNFAKSSPSPSSSDPLCHLSV